MVSLFALYRKPENADTFLDHYRTIHAPLALRLPGLCSLEWGMASGLPSGDADDWFLVAEMRFESSQAAMEALKSPEGRAAAADIRTFAEDLLTMRMVEWQ
jgi:uncharacterized protein (TIGR02118 family)